MDEKLDSTEETVKDEAKVEEQEVSTEEAEKTEETVEEKLAELEKADRKSTRLNSSHIATSRMPSSA